jgi:hypothetical protein
MSTERTSGQKKEWVRWVDMGLLISVEVPAHWQAFRNPKFELFLQGTGPEGLRPCLTVQKVEVPASNRAILDTLEHSLLAELKPNKDFRLLEQKTLTLDEIFQANLYRVGWTNSKGVRLVQWLMLVSGGRAFFQLMMTTPANEAERLEPLVERVFSSVRFRLRKLAEANATLARTGANQE